MLLGITPHIASPETVANKPRTLAGALPRTKHLRAMDFLRAKHLLSRPAARHFYAIVQRIVVTCLAVLVSVVVPEFSAMMAFLGAFSAFMLCVIGPVAAKIALTRTGKMPLPVVQGKGEGRRERKQRWGGNPLHRRSANREKEINGDVGTHKTCP